MQKNIQTTWNFLEKDAAFSNSCLNRPEKPLFFGHTISTWESVSSSTSESGFISFAESGFISSPIWPKS